MIFNKHTTSSPPLSASNYAVNLGCLALFFLTLFVVKKALPTIGRFELMTLCLFAVVVPLWIYDFVCVRVHQRPSTGIDFARNDVNHERVVIKLIGLNGTFIIILLLYWTIPMYRSSFFDFFFYFLKYFGAAIVFLSIVYFFFLDRKQKDPYDEFWHMGCLLTGRFDKVNRIVIYEYARVWFIKGFFTPVMFGLLSKYVGFIASVDHTVFLSTFMPLYGYLITFFYAVDVIYGILGYSLTCRLSDTHIRSTDPTVIGWLVCLMCYAPFYHWFGIGLFKYDDGFSWDTWLVLYPGLLYFCGVTILFLVCVYCLATVAIGYRMSNLTYRGIITSGPYRFTKHPAFIGKVGSWWLISLPFLSIDSPLLALKHTLALSVITVIYYIRARTEENHLSNYPEYVEYANWMNSHGCFRGITKILPFLKYSEEKCKRWGSVVWFKRL